ncbi:MAG: ABC transporter substrate-binding protein [Eubacteriaceae bacterium]|nr:ABC transporter substrate-binding protein [Eubacteriaceae bacterium]
MKKRIILLIALLCIVFFLSGCWKANEPSGTDEQSFEIIDSAGRSVIIPEKVEKIACLYAFTGHALGLLEQDDKIVAVVEGLKRDKLFVKLFPDIDNALVPFTDGSINIEELIKADPDVVFVRSDTASNEQEMKKISELGIPAVCADYTNMEEQIQAVEIIGKVCGGDAVKKAEAYTKYYRKCIALAEERTKNLSAEEKIKVYHSVNEAVRTDSEDSLSADWMESAGVINVSVDKELNLVENKNYASLEQIFIWDPEVIIANEEGVANYILTDSKWKGLDAVNNRTVYQMPVGISRWGHPGSIETPLAILWLDKTLYPDLFKDIDLYKETKNFYKTFFSYTLSDQDVKDILSGTGMRIKKTD